MNKQTQDLILANVKAIEQGEPLEYFPAWGEIMSKDTSPHISKVRIAVGDGWERGNPEGYQEFLTMQAGNDFMNRIRRTTSAYCVGFDIELFFDSCEQPLKIIDHETERNQYINLLQDKLNEWQYIQRSTNLHKIYKGLAYINGRVAFWQGLLDNEMELE